ncbi:hypothetical protein FRC02_002833 [Tulasnella sp. 418]|nr:hypothetical protein FRC02_002833 [Tulasnella sp. 418]
MGLEDCSIGLGQRWMGKGFEVGTFDGVKESVNVKEASPLVPSTQRKAMGIQRNANSPYSEVIPLLLCPKVHFLEPSSRCTNEVTPDGPHWKRHCREGKPLWYLLAVEEATRVEGKGGNTCRDLSL